MLTNEALLTECVKKFNKVIISTGMSTQEEIDNAVKVLQDAQLRYGKVESIGMLHCNSTYPAPIDELNLSGIKTLIDKYP
jgi:sialic acid synthase SpsE